ncbi:hypothetical protein CA267_018640 [Alteromonas pelagimontana]|uniref:Calcineurin-like phosphoesterase domain-containing protein n=1 Tax=Alteromonas pelagimontana TaxID=1858656 RepID=A0A6M4MKM1_9ALTE|nr:metallophosphoesterase family protein [Alteromonas pelagimontana]QJR82626.1 hypothetical protein CA267_018640 [Alteromonas pelagimontana]
MIRILAFSDIHNNLTCVDKLISQVSGEKFDCVVVAGDIGNQTAPTFFEKLSVLPFPICYVYGNWDSKLSYNTKFSDNSIHLHQNIQEIGGYYVVGFSGCPAHWGHNPIYIDKKKQLESNYSATLSAHREIKRKIKEKKRGVDALTELEDSKDFRDYLHAKKTLIGEINHENKRALAALLVDEKQVDMRKVIIVTHERLTKITDYFPEPPLLTLFGHLHKYSFKQWRDCTFINISHLDNQPSSFKQKPKRATPGNYCIITIENGAITSEQVDLIHL